MGPDPRLQGSSRSETRGLVAAIINSFNETGNPPVARVHHTVPGPPWQNVHIRWKDDGSCVPIVRSPLALMRAPTPGTRANAPESVDHAHPPRPASPTPRDQRKRPREDVRALGALPNGAATKRKTNGQPASALCVSRPLIVHPKRTRTRFSEEWNPDSDPRLGRIFRLRVDRDGNPRGEAIFADDKYPLRWVRLVTTEHQLLFGNRPSGVYAACATEAKNWEAANRAFSRAESRATKNKNGKRKQIVFYESLDLEFLESKHDVEYLDLHRYPHPGASGRETTATVRTEMGEKKERRAPTAETSADAIAKKDKQRRRSDGGVLARLADLAVAATADAAPEVRHALADENEDEDEDVKEPPEAPGSPERVARRASRAPPPPFLFLSAEPKDDAEAGPGPGPGGTNERRFRTNGLDFGGLADRIAPDVPATDDGVRGVSVSVPSADARGDREADLVDVKKKKRASSAHRAAAPAPAYVTAGPGPADSDSSLGVLTADRDLREEVRLLKMRLEHVDCRLRIEREERRLNETRLMAALRESRRALERVRAAVERDADA